jgi:hypothetical protein
MDHAEQARVTREAYDRLAPVWSRTTDKGPFNGLLERPAVRSLVPRPIRGASILDAGCGSGSQCEWLWWTIPPSWAVQGPGGEPYGLARRHSSQRCQTISVDELVMADGIGSDP